MDAPLASDEEGEKTLLDTFASDMRTDNFSETEAMRVKLFALMRGLSDTEKAVVCGIFGFGTEEVSEYTLSKKFNLTEERIRQIKWAAIAKMKELA
jgi:DNA-directed RNA polymerase sigma subunit (sigma70/sigma32)